MGQTVQGWHLPLSQVVTVEVQVVTLVTVDLGTAATQMAFWQTAG
jgi:hypothetical protein